MKISLLIPMAAIVGAALSSFAAGPATVSSILKESELTTITLTGRASSRLGIQTVLAARRAVTKTRLFPGELIVAQPELERARTDPGSPGQSIFPLLARMTPAEQIRVSEAQIRADGEIEAAAIRVEAAQQRLDRAKNLVRNKAGSARAVEEAATDLRLAQSTHRQSRQLRELLGAPLLPGATPDRLWVRVPVYVGDAATISTSQVAEVGDPSGRPAASPRVARPVSTPASTAPGSAAVHLFYEIENADRTLRVGQKVGVRVQLGEKAERLVVPWSGVVMDINGGTWVYEQTQPLTFVRRRVQVLWLEGAEAVLSTGPEAGAAIVAQGAAELFGTEVGFSK